MAHMQVVQNSQGGMFITGFNAYEQYAYKQKPYQFKVDSPAGESTVARYDWSANPDDEQHTVVQSLTLNSINWYTGTTNSESTILGLKIWAKFWYNQATDTDPADDEHKSFTTLPIYIYVIPKGLGIGLPIQPLPSNYEGSMKSNSNVYIDPPIYF